MSIDDIRNDIKLINKELVGIRNEMRGLVEIQQRLIHERLGVPTPSAPPMIIEGGASIQKGNVKKINITSLDNDTIKVYGNTFNVKDIFKTIPNARWDPSSKGWTMPTSALNVLTNGLEQTGLKKDVDYFVFDITEETNQTKENNDTCKDVCMFNS